MQNKWVELTKHFEGLRLKPYTCTAGKLTIGFGHNLEDNGITLEIAEILLRTDLACARMEVFAKFPWLMKLNEPRQYVLVDMCFNIGISRLLTFKKMLLALQEGDYERAAHEMLDSKWAKQVGKRATRLAEIMRKGEY